MKGKCDICKANFEASGGKEHLATVIAEHKKKNHMTDDEKIGVVLQDTFEMLSRFAVGTFVPPRDAEFLAKRIQEILVQPKETTKNAVSNSVKNVSVRQTAIPETVSSNQNDATVTANGDASAVSIQQPVVESSTKE